MGPMKKTVKKPLKKPAARKTKKFSHLSDAEKDLVKKWHSQGKSATEVAEWLDRNASTVDRHFKRIEDGSADPKVGRRRVLTAEQEGKVVKTAYALIEAADSEWTVTAAMIRSALKLDCCDRVVLDALHKHNIYFHPMREKPVRTEDDEKARAKFGKDHMDMPFSYWTKTAKGFIDNKFFQVYLNAKQRAFGRKRKARGSFRAPGKGLAKGHTKPPKNLKPGSGKLVHVAVAISATKVLICHFVKGCWGGKAAEEMYVRSLGPAIRRAYPKQRRFLVLEDNDPTGYKAHRAVAAKEAEKIDVLELPKRSPDLNPLDYSFWHHVNEKLRAQEAKFDEDYRETRQDFEKRLKRTIMRVPASVLTPMVRNMKHRCGAVMKAKGGNFEEGGKAKA